MTNRSKYAAATGFGWQTGRISSADRKTGSALERDVNLTADGTFVIDVPKGTYSVSVWLGDHGTTTYDQMGVFLEGSQVDTVSPAAGSLESRTYSVAVNDGQLTLQLKDLGGRNKYVAIAGLTVTYVGVAPAPLGLRASSLPSDLPVSAAPSARLAEDVNGDGRVTALDALILTNYLNSQGVGAGRSDGALPSGDRYAYDVSGDGRITPWDALLVANALNAAAALSGRGHRRSRVVGPRCGVCRTGGEPAGGASPSDPAEADLSGRWT